MYRTWPWLWVTRCVTYKRQGRLNHCENLVSPRFVVRSLFLTCLVSMLSFCFALSSFCLLCLMLPLFLDYPFLITRISYCCGIIILSGYLWLVLTRLIRRVPLVEKELLILPDHLSSPPVLSGVRVTRSLVLCVCFE